MTAKPDDFRDGPLHKMLVRVLPIYTDAPFSEAPKLDVQKLIERSGKSHEAVYIWLRKSRLTPENAILILGICNTAENVAILAKLDREPPTLRDFDTFVFGA